MTTILKHPLCFPPGLIPLLGAILTVVFAPLPRATAAGIPGYAVVPLSAQKYGNQATIRVSVDGQPALLVLDTGAGTSLLDSGFYKGVRSKSTNVTPEELPAGIPHQTSGNGVKADVSYVHMQAGGYDFGKGPIAVMDLSGMFAEYNNYYHKGSINGLLGEDLLRHYAAVIDWRRRGVYFNLDPSKRMKNLGRELVSSGWTAVPMKSTSSKNFTVPCTVNGKSVELLVDTGAGFTTFQPGIVPLEMLYNRDTHSSMAHLASMAATSSMIGGDSTLFPARIEHWKVGSYEIEQSVVSVHKFPKELSEESTGGAPILGLLGAEIMATNNAIIDIAGSTLYLKPSAKPKAKR